MNLIIRKHKTKIIHAHNSLHTVYWAQAAWTAGSIGYGALAASLCVLTLLVAYCTTCHE